MHLFYNIFIIYCYFNRDFKSSYVEKLIILYKVTFIENNF